MALRRTGRAADAVAAGAAAEQDHNVTRSGTLTHNVIAVSYTHLIGETLLGRRSVKKGVIAAILGSIVYRFIYAIVFYTKIVPVECLKLLTAVIVALAIASPSIRRWFAFQKRKMSARTREGA